MKELTDKIQALAGKIQDLINRVNLVSKQNEINNLEAKMSDPAFWQDQVQARLVSQQAANLKTEVSGWQNLEQEIKDLSALSQEDEVEQSASLTKDLTDQFYKLEKQFSQLEIKTVLNGKYDSANAVLTIYAGAGGTEAQDWAEMLKRMYLRFCENKNWPIKIINESRGNEAGIKSVMLEISGDFVYGFLKAESGVHRLVRLSPFDADHARHTSFAMVEVTPELDSSVGSELEIKSDDLKIEANTATGHGGQSVNTTYSAIRLTHIPTGIKVSCQNERSQQQNRETALKILQGKLAKYYEAQQEEERMRIRGELTEAAWGNQIRSYVLHPYKMVKDHRTDYEEHEPDAVLNGELDSFIEVYLRSQIG
ncbi:MAG: peptide chain release factor 2 [Candidatus Komeilibacteria bacterium]|nr:peptide chain release factor 2 [Candidatus Komeilibacteria bacterium]